MRRILIRRVARNDIDGISDYISQDNPRRANSFIEEIYHKIQVIAERPLSFPTREDVSTGLRSALHGNYLILFRIVDDEIHISRVVHGSRDLDSLF
jgi:toxin ParE1/3/4